MSEDRPKILIVDDRRDNLLALRAGLRDCGCRIVEALSGAEALERILEHEFAAILLDVQMPHIDGYEVARKIRAGSHNQSSPILFLTAIEREERYERQGYTVGAVDYLYKPLNIDILNSKIAVFAELYRKNRENLRQAELLREAALKEQENRLLRHSLKIRDDFLSMAAHELNTPITPLNLQIQAFLQMYRDGSIDHVPRETVLRLLETSESQVSRLSRLVGDLVDVSRIRSGKIKIRREEVCLRGLVGEVIAAFREEISSIGAEVSVTAEGAVRGKWDRFRIEQVVINLLKNSLKYGGGKPVLIRLSREGESVSLEVADQGIGIAPEHQERIFGRFERAVSEQHYGGLGLGLYITEEIVRLHGGSISVRSKLGAGSTFSVSLPVQAV